MKKKKVKDPLPRLSMKVLREYMWQNHRAMSHDLERAEKALEEIDSFLKYVEFIRKH